MKIQIIPVLKDRLKESASKRNSNKSNEESNEIEKVQLMLLLIYLTRDDNSNNSRVEKTIERNIVNIFYYITIILRVCT